MHVSYAELIRIAPESIRMVGFTFDQADDAVEGFVWTQCVLGHGYDLLRMADERHPRHGWRAHHVGNIDQGAVEVDLAGLPAFAFAARLADCARTIASETGDTGSVTAIGSFGGWIAPYIAYRLGRADYHAAVLWLPEKSASGDEAPATAVIATASRDRTRAPISLRSEAAYRLNAGETSAQHFVPMPLLENVVTAAQRPRHGSLLFIGAAVDCRRQRPSLGGEAALKRICGTVPAPMTSRSFDGVQDLRHAIDQGIEVAPEDHAILNQLSYRIRLPNTERSKSQAG
jgi:hypothetical protein